MTYPYGSQPSRYLEEAAALLRKASEMNESDNKSCPTILTNGRERIAMKFAQLAAIEQGLVPVEMVQDLLRALRPELQDASR